MAEETVLASNPRLVGLRQHLAAARAVGLDFSEAWAGGRQLALGGLARAQREEWQSALARHPRGVAARLRGPGV